jgi:hypothetical protein
MPSAKKKLGIHTPWTAPTDCYVFYYDMIAKEVLKILIMCRKNSWSNLGGHYSGYEIGVMETWGTNPHQAFLIRKQKFTWKIAWME